MSKQTCAFCENFRWESASFKLKPSRVCVSICGFDAPKEEQFNYCPACGRPNPNKKRGGNHDIT